MCDLPVSLNLTKALKLHHPPYSENGHRRCKSGVVLSLPICLQNTHLAGNVFKQSKCILRSCGTSDKKCIFFAAHGMQGCLHALSPEMKLSYRSSYNSCLWASRETSSISWERHPWHFALGLGTSSAPLL